MINTQLKSIYINMYVSHNFAMLHAQHNNSCFNLDVLKGLMGKYRQKTTGILTVNHCQHRV